MIPGFMEVYISPGGIWRCAKCDKAMLVDGRILQHWDGPNEIEKCPQKGMGFKVPVQTFPVYRHPEDGGQA